MYNPHRRVKELSGEGGYVWLRNGQVWSKTTCQKAIHLEIGEPDFPTPKNIIDATIRALNEGKTRYTQLQGIPELREAVAKFLGDKRNVKIDPSQVVISHGTKCLIRASMEVLVDPDKPNTAFIIPDPGYGPYLANANYTGAKIYPFPMDEKKEWRFEPNSLKKIVDSIPKDMRKVFILVSPSNPTGGVYTQEDLEFVADLARKHDMFIIADEIYDDIIFDGKFHSIYSLPGMPERTCLLHGASKSWSMTGYRLGWGAFPKDMARYIEKMVGHSNSSVAQFVQYAGIEAVSGPQDSVETMRKEYLKRRDYAVKSLRAMGCYCAMPKGAFYIFPNATTWMQKVNAKTDQELAERILHECGVVCLPGSIFGGTGKDHLRFSLASSLENIQEGMERIKKWLDSGGKPIFKCEIEPATLYSF
jgi:aspartate aminotransferase